MVWKKNNIVISFILPLFFINGCGYTMRTALPSKYRKIYIEPFKNKTGITEETRDQERLRLYYPLLETKITNAVINRFIFDGNLKVVKKDNADIVLNGELISYQRDPLRYDDNRNVEEYRLSIVVNLVLLEAETEKMVWQETNFVGDTTYFTSGASAKSESSAIEDAITDLVRRVVERTVENW